MTLQILLSPPHFVSASSPSLVLSRAQAVPAQLSPEAAKSDFASLAEGCFQSNDSVVVWIVNVPARLSFAVWGSVRQKKIRVGETKMA